jgi:hypothetical protein
VAAPGGDCAGVGGVGWRAIAVGWPTPGAPPAEGCTGAEPETGDDGGWLTGPGVADGVEGTSGAEGVDVGVGGRKSEP